MNIKTCRHCDIRFIRDDAAPIPHDLCERCHVEIDGPSAGAPQPMAGSEWYAGVDYICEEEFA